MLLNRLFLLLIITTIFVACNQEYCIDFEDDFSSFQEAEKAMYSTDFALKDSFDTSKSSWITEAKYYSCDNENGYLIFKTQRKSYLHKDVPKKIWEELKNASSFGSYYNNVIKGKYQVSF